MVSKPLMVVITPGCCSAVLMHCRYFTLKVTGIPHPPRKAWESGCWSPAVPLDFVRLEGPIAFVGSADYNRAGDVTYCDLKLSAYKWK